MLHDGSLDGTVLGRSIQWQADGIAIVSKPPSCPILYPNRKAFPRLGISLVSRPKRDVPKGMQRGDATLPGV